MDKAKLLTSRLGERDVEVPGVGTVRVRALSRTEALGLRGLALPEDESERRLLSLAMIDPKLTEDEVRQWQDASGAGEIQPVAAAIVALSGMEATTAKETVQRFRG